MKQQKALLKKFFKKLLKKTPKHERGSALVIVALILALLTIYVSASLMNATSDAVSSNFEVAKKKAFFSAYSKLEQMTGDFSNLFLTSLSPSYDSMCRVVVKTPTDLNGFDLKVPKVNCPDNSPCTPLDDPTKKYTVGTNLFDLGWEGDPPPPTGFCLVDVCHPEANIKCGYPLRPTNAVTIPRGDYAGLQGFARRFRMVATARAQSSAGADVQVTRDFNNYLIPAFQFGIFSDTDFELYIPPSWTFGGWVHTNGNFYATGDFTGDPPQARNIFRQYAFDNNNNMVTTAARITVAKHLIIGKEKSGANGDTNNTADFIRVFTDATNFVDVSVGTSTTGAKNPGTPNNCGTILSSEDTPDANCVSNPSFPSPVKVGVRPLKLPIQNLLGLNAVEIIKRGLPSDFAPTIASPLVAARYYYKPGIRVTLADYQNQLPRQVKSTDNPAAGTGPYGGIQLDGPDPWLAENVGTGTTNLVKTGSASDPNWYYMKDDPSDPDNTIKNYRWPIPRGYQPKVKDPISGNARPTGARVNGSRIHGWIKIELVKANGQTFDITEEFLNLGVTVPFQADTAAANIYYPRSTASASSVFPPTLPLDMGNTTQKAGPYPDEHSILHIQRMAVPYRTNVIEGPDVSGSPNLPALSDATAFGATLDNVSTQLTFDYYSSMALGRYSNISTTSLQMFGIRDDEDKRPLTCTGCPGGVTIGRKAFTTRYASTVTTSDTTSGNTNPAPYAEPQPDPGGYYTHSTKAALPVNVANNIKTEIDFTGAGTATRPTSETTNFYKPTSTATFISGLTYNAGFALSENVNLPKAKDDKVLAIKDKNFLGETTWRIKNGTTEVGLVPFPINIYDSREGLPHQASGGTGSTTYGNKRKPVPGLESDAVGKPGVMNLIEIDMGNLGRFLKGDFDNLFSQMGTTSYKTATGGALKAATAASDFTDLIHENIKINQDNGWVVYISDRRGDEPMVATNTNLKTPSSQYPATPNNGTAENVYANPLSVIGDGAYHRENVIWTTSGDITSGIAQGLERKLDAGATKYGCDGSVIPVKSDNQDTGKSPHDSNNDCFIASEDGRGSGTANYSETASYADMFDDDQSISSWPSNNLDYSPTITNVTARQGNLVAMTKVPTVDKKSWIYKPPVAYRDSANDQRVEIFRRAVRTVNASNLFPTGPATNPTCTTAKLGVSLATENPVYVFGNFNAPAGRNIDEDTYPGINSNSPGAPTSLANYNGQTFATCGNNCHVPSSIVSDAMTLLSGANVGTGTPAVFANWSGANGTNGWMDARTFVRPYQAIGIRTGRNTVYRFALITGFTPSWYPSFWGDSNWNQGPDSEYTSGALNNFPRFLEDWGINSSGQQYVTYGGSLIRAFKSQQGNGAFKRNSGADQQTDDNSGDVDYVYVPPRRDWVFDLDFSQPCTLPPATPFLQLVDFKGFQESSVQQREQ